ncbi:MAG: response regulator transcription factor [Propionibacteriaceae bacterium]|jgi:two-component system response regulator MtrA|nr:response regulator transcription factor [Propionibacteriaceae bacterium]
MSDPQRRILVVDDDEALAEMLQIVLVSEGYSARTCFDGSQAIGVFRDYEPDLVLLDLMLPGRDGVDVCRDIREESDVPIVMLTAKSDTIDVVRGLEAGADDYISKPFKTQELVARIKTRLRRRPSAADDGRAIQLGDVTIDLNRHQVRRNGVTVKLTPLEYDILAALASRPRHAFSREALLEEVWGYHNASDTRLVNVHVQRLRAKIESDPENPKIVVTVRGLGYRAGQVRQ